MRDVIILSLAENCDSPLMWAHYGVRHTGVLIGFDSENANPGAADSNIQLL